MYEERRSGELRSIMSSIGVSIEEVINNPHAKYMVRELWQNQARIRADEEKKADAEDRKTRDFWEVYAMQTARRLAAYGWRDPVRIVQTMRWMVKMFRELWPYFFLAYILQKCISS